MSKTDIEKVHRVLGRKVRVVLTDDRVIEGQFQCMDKDMNLVIGDAMEYHKMLSSKDPLTFVTCPISDLPSRRLGCAVVPGEHMVGIFCDMEDPT